MKTISTFELNHHSLFFEIDDNVYLHKIRIKQFLSHIDSLCSSFRTQKIKWKFDDVKNKLTLYGYDSNKLNFVEYKIKIRSHISNKYYIIFDVRNKACSNLETYRYFNLVFNKAICNTFTFSKLLQSKL